MTNASRGIAPHLRMALNPELKAVPVKLVMLA
eukprot:CAMPEP_0170585392 /NCGR_PEP_ID=MMETSP0224-20130122/9187_1 /TAXON_ID=285029 /ORGANISM="Togula jolla, Strain CCCM 725" /LENGTH=31 /DNA_ID= /DNA_START= /DNA_END= /DNA_ORIENTATION=